jgi:hypothetical protein
LRKHIYLEERYTTTTTTTTTKPLIPDKLEYARNETQSENIRSKTQISVIIMNMMEEKENK